MNAKLVELAVSQLSTLEKFVEDAENSEGLIAIIADVKMTLAMVQPER